jgi:predicted amidophosphoribosyltransferase
MARSSQPAGAIAARIRNQPAWRRNRAPSTIAGVLRALLDLLAPPACVVCRAPGQLLCGSCRGALVFLPPERCTRCGLRRPCGPPCPAATAAYSASWAPVAYSASARALVAALKFRGALAVADVMAAQIAAGAPADLLRDSVLVPVPTHPSRRRARGFDQAERIAVALGRRTGVAVHRCLRRGGAPARQLGASRSARLAGGRISIACAGAAPETCTLIDDVHTTGATLDACAAALRAAGARHVWALTYARTL